MRLDQALVKRGFCESRQEAQECIDQGFVLVDTVITTKKTRQVNEDAAIEVTRKRTFVSRGGDKLEGILRDVYKDKETIQKNLEGRTAIDVGSSTGGFTDCLLSYGVTSVTAVDVGTAQLHAKLRKNSKVTLFENTDIRNFKPIDTFNIIVVDLSFISLTKVIDILISLGTDGTDYFLLIKPQFEVGFGNTKKGIVKDKALIEDVVAMYSTVCKEKGLYEVKLFPCAITGGDGNQEYFIHAKK
jgi:23S rRNA (cytidine1920-2'-O)/16S rRNA (cytidine1409-2'-O)-methyltransferase